jgi:hypothetical protein
MENAISAIVGSNPDLLSNNHAASYLGLQPELRSLALYETPRNPVYQMRPAGEISAQRPRCVVGIAHRTGGSMNAPNLPDVARSMLKALIVSLATSGLITSADAEHLIAFLGLERA